MRVFQCDYCKNALGDYTKARTQNNTWIVKISDVPINWHQQVLALFEGICIGSYLKNLYPHHQNFADTLPIPFNNLTIINCLSWLKSATLELYKTNNNLENTDMSIVMLFLNIQELLGLLLEFALYLYKNYY